MVARRASSASLASKASSTLQLRTTRQQVRKMVMALSPMSRHQPREMSLLAGPFMVEKLRSAAVRRA